MLYQLSYSRNIPAGSNVSEPVVGGGFEPPKSFDGRFTVCSLWPLGNPTREIDIL